MVRSFPISGLLVVAVICTAAAESDDALRSAYAAYQQQDYVSAIHYYQRATRTSTDPGPLADDLGSVFAKAERFQEAAAWFTRSLEDAHGLRLAKSAYGLATSLTQLASKMQGRRAVALLQQALTMYEVALREMNSLTPQDLTKIPTLKADAEHNRSVAESLLAQKQKEPEPPDSIENEAPPLTNDSALNNPGEGIRNSGRATPLTRHDNAGNGAEEGTNESTAGRGNLPPLPDDDIVPPLSPEEAQRRLDQLLKRLRKPLTQAAGKPGIRDW